MINVNLHTNLCKYEKDDLNHPFLYKMGLNNYEKTTNIFMVNKRKHRKNEG